MAAALQSSISLRNPNLNSNTHGTRTFPTLYRLSASSSFRFGAPCAKGCAVAACLLHLTQSSLQRRRLGCGPLSIDRRISKLVTFAAQSEDSNNELEIEKNDSQEEWKQMLESFKQEAIKMQGVSQEAYDVYSKKMMVVLKETSEKLKIQADKARHDLTILTKELSEEGKEYLSEVAKDSPDSVKDIVETFSSSPDELKNISEARDFYLGIPYGAFLAIGGFLSFMLTGSTSAIRFGVILGSALLALSVASLRSWRSGQSSALFLKGQAAIATIIFVREWRLLFQRPSFLTCLMTLISGAMLVFYAYRITVDGRNKGPNLEPGSEN